MKQERWKDIPGYEGLYQASTLGRIKSLTRLCHYRDGRERIHKGTMLRPGRHPEGGLHVQLSKEGRIKTYEVHRLVLLAFRGPPKKDQEARHFPDRSKSNNALSNLLWGTKKENEDDKEFHGTRARGDSCSWAKLTDRQVDKIRKRYLKGDITQSTLAFEYGVTQTTISGIVRFEDRIEPPVWIFQTLLL